MANRKTIAARILNAASKEKTINNSTLRRRMRIPTTEVDQVSFNNSIMRTARFLTEEGMLKRTDRGQFSITKKGLKAVNA
jgi:predicted transcriptional regulator